jgi:hypothetical protein
MEWLVKLIFFLMLLPFFISLALQLLAALLQAIIAFFVALLPWLIIVALIITAVAGLSAGLVMTRRFPPKTGGRLPPRGVQPVRRPRGPGRQDEE